MRAAGARRRPLRLNGRRQLTYTLIQRLTPRYTFILGAVGCIDPITARSQYSRQMTEWQCDFYRVYPFDRTKCGVSLAVKVDVSLVKSPPDDKALDAN